MISVMVKCGVLFEVRTGFLNNIQTSFDFKDLNWNYDREGRRDLWHWGQEVCRQETLQNRWDAVWNNMELEAANASTCPAETRPEATSQKACIVDVNVALCFHIDMVNNSSFLWPLFCHNLWAQRTAIGVGFHGTQLAGTGLQQLPHCF
jgi:hypothetical protein